MSRLKTSILLNHMFSWLQFQINGKQCGVTPSQDSDTLYLGNICKTWTKEAVSIIPLGLPFALSFVGWVVFVVIYPELC